MALDVVGRGLSEREQVGGELRADWLRLLVPIRIGQSLEQASAIDAYEKANAATATMYETVDVKYYSNGR